MTKTRKRKKERKQIVEHERLTIGNGRTHTNADSGFSSHPLSEGDSFLGPVGQPQVLVIGST